MNPEDSTRYSCACGSTRLLKNSLRNHSKSKRHLRYLEEVPEQSPILTCNICYSDDRAEFFQCPTCSNKHCTDCHGHMNRCPFCRASWQVDAPRSPPYVIGNGVMPGLHYGDDEDSFIDDDEDLLLSLDDDEDLLLHLDSEDEHDDLTPLFQQQLPYYEDESDDEEPTPPLSVDEEHHLSFIRYQRAIERAFVHMDVRYVRDGIEASENEMHDMVQFFYERDHIYNRLRHQ